MSEKKTVGELQAGRLDAFVWKACEKLDAVADVDWDRVHEVAEKVDWQRNTDKNGVPVPSPRCPDCGQLGDASSNPNDEILRCFNLRCGVYEFLKSEDNNAE